jgi:nucleotide-binding universal stress UspA family protein
VQSARPILGAFKDTAVGRHALSAAAWLARSLDTPLLLAHAFDPTGIALPERRDMFVSALSEDDLERGARLHARRKLEAAAQTITGVEVRTELTEGTPDPALLGLAAEHRASLLVIGSAGRAGLDRVLGGSLPADVAVRAPCPVVVVTADAALEGRGPVVAGYDGSEQSGRAARYAATLARSCGTWCWFTPRVVARRVVSTPDYSASSAYSRLRDPGPPMPPTCESSASKATRSRCWRDSPATRTPR